MNENLKHNVNEIKLKLNKRKVDRKVKEKKMTKSP